MDTFNDPWPSPPVLDGLSSDQMDSLAELHENSFEPQIRARSNTWPLPRPENFVEPSDDTENNQQTSNQQSLTGRFSLITSEIYSVGLCLYISALKTVIQRKIHSWICRKNGNFSIRGFNLIMKNCHVSIKTMKIISNRF